MPLAELLQLLHCAAVANGARTEWSVSFPEDDAILDARLARLRAQKSRRTTDNGQRTTNSEQ